MKKQPIYYSPAEEVLLWQRTNMPELDLDSIVSLDHVPISEAVFEACLNLGPKIERVTKYPFEFYVEGFSQGDDPTVRSVFLPSQDLVNAVSFNLSPMAIRETHAYLQSLRQNDESWNTIASVHGHGRAKVYGADTLAFSRKDIEEHMVHFLMTKSLSTRRVVNTPVPLAGLLNHSLDVMINEDSNTIVLSDGRIFSPEIVITGLGKEAEAKLRQRLGTKQDLKKIVKAYLLEAAKSESTLAVQARQYSLVSHQYFLVFDNYGNSHAEIGIISENAITHQTRIHRKKVPIKPIKDKDQKYDSDAWTERVRVAFSQHLKLMRDTAKVNLDFSAKARDDLLKTERVEKEHGDTRLEDLTTAFALTSLKYISQARRHEYKYSQFLSNVIRLYAQDFKTTWELGKVFEMFAPQGNIAGDDNSPFIYQGLHLFLNTITANIMKGIKVSSNQKRDVDFMNAFSKASIPGQYNRCIERYVSLVGGK